MNMSQAIKTDLLPKLCARYERRNREGKTRMLDELCEDYGYERKYAIKLLRDTVPAPSGRKHPGPEPRYALIEPVVRTIWLAAEQPCGKRLASALPLWLRHYERHHDQLTARQRERLREISPATLDRLLASAQAEHPLRGRCGTKPGSLLKTEIPIRTGTWDVTQPGYLEADSVAHCGASLAGNFIWSLTYTDIASQWTEGRAVWNKGATRRAGGHADGGGGAALRAAGLRLRQRQRVPEPAPAGLPARAAAVGGLHALAPVSQG